ncbi:MAG TPA: hypothetical protein VK151_02025 [Fluviicola sp.]|nr:hypothetical protein [Fluviicola sp.]
MFRIKYFFPVFLVILVASCTISGEQEEQLNNQMGKYLNAHNNGQLLQLIGLTQPEVVRFYKNQGDSLFVRHFKDLKDGEKTYMVDPTYREMKAEGKLVQRKYWVQYYTNKAEINHRYNLYALSRDGGDNWFFLREDEYANSAIQFKRLFK